MGVLDGISLFGILVVLVEESGSHLTLTSDEEGLCPWDDGEDLAFVSKDNVVLEGVVDGGVADPVTLVFVLKSSCWSVCE